MHSSQASPISTHFGVRSQALLTHNAKVYLAARDASKGLKAIEDLKASTGGKEALFLKLDLADLRSVRQAAEEFLRFVFCSFF